LFSPAGLDENFIDQVPADQPSQYADSYAIRQPHTGVSLRVTGIDGHTKTIRVSSAEFI